MPHALIATLAFALLTVAVLMLGLGIKSLLRKGDSFKRPCSSIDPYTGKGTGCVCARLPKTQCNKPPYQPLDVNQHLLEEIAPTH